MKKLIVLFLLASAFIGGPVRAQDFNGTIKWTTRMEFTDPEMARKVKEAQAQLADPEVQAKLKEAQEAMKSPEMQAMLAQNPQLKDMMGKQMGALNPAAASGDVIPKGFTLQIKGPRALVKTEGGLIPTEVLTLADQNVAYSIDRKARTYHKLSQAAAAPSAEKPAQFKVTRTNETATIFKYTCHRYLVETIEGKTKTNYSVWATTEIKGLNADTFDRMQLGKGKEAEFFSQIEGVPLKIDVITSEAKITMVVANITPGTLPDAVFALPAGFKETVASAN
ncbi:MAG: DUF4412 domain-containing protein [Opitutaceae bacterium]|jgi:hypothetical protein